MFDKFTALPTSHKRALLTTALNVILVANATKKNEEAIRQERRKRAADRSRKNRAMYSPKPL